ncbi:TolC family protein [Hyphobacterium sp. CCMP332]|nr:TolC family protein [Hyphobacterium sp. CCMP332]
MNAIKIIMFLYLLIHVSMVKGQSEISAGNKLKPLELLLQIAQDNSNAFKAMEAQQLNINQEISGLKKNWMEHIFLTGNINYGTGNVLDEVNNSGIQGLNYTNRKNTFYNLGINLYLPVSKIANRKHQIKAKEFRIEELEHLKQESLSFLNSEIIKQYNNLEYHLKELKLLSEIVHTYETDKSFAENAFRQGNISIEVYKSSIDTYYSSKVNFEKAKSQAQLCARLLTELVGQPIFEI